MTKHYQCVLFDLDHTLWDYETNSKESLLSLFEQYKLSSMTESSFAEFFKTFIRVNNSLWDQYDRGEIHRDVLRTERFHKVLLGVGIDRYEMSLQFSNDYLAESPKKKNLMPGAIEILNYLAAVYPMYIITNGFDEIQYTKMSSSGITTYFKKVYTSEKIGHKKPSREIFDHVLNELGHLSSAAIMIGDNLLTDITGARNAGIDQVYFNPSGSVHNESVTYEIKNLIELRNIL